MPTPLKPKKRIHNAQVSLKKEKAKTIIRRNFPYSSICQSEYGIQKDEVQMAQNEEATWTAHAFIC